MSNLTRAGLRGVLVAAAGISFGAAALDPSPVRNDTPFAFDVLCKQDFLIDIWATRSSLLDSSVIPVHELFNTADLVELLRRDDFQVVGGTLVDDTTSVSVQPTRRPGSKMEFFRNATLIVSGLESKLPRLALWSSHMASSLGVTSDISMYLTPSSTQALSVHNDKQDTVAVQAFGSKSWKIWDTHEFRERKDIDLDIVEHPFRHVVALAANHGVPLEAFPKPTVEAKLTPNAIVYIPRGALHVASTANATVSSVHLSIGAWTQSSSYAIALFHLAAEAPLRDAILSAGWTIHHFRQTLMRIVDDKTEGIDFRKSLPLGWLQSLDPNNQTSCADLAANSEMEKVAKESIRSMLEVIPSLVRRVFLRSPAPPSDFPRITDGSLRPVAAVFDQHLSKHTDDLKAAASLSRTPLPEILEFPPDVFISYIAWGVDPYGAGEVDVRFSWCTRPVEEQGMAKALWPAGVLPMLQKLAASNTSRMNITDLGNGADVIPSYIFATELTRLPLDPPFRLVPQGSVGRKFSRQRSPDC
jgi:hypothetical protein